VGGLPLNSPLCVPMKLRNTRTNIISSFVARKSI
jgi:hypothetical protein